MGSNKTAGRRSARPAQGTPPEHASAELREANERLVMMGVRMQELIEEAENARHEAEAASQAKNEFLAALSHELRTPLNAILGWTQILRRTALTGAAADRALEIIERNAKLQAQLIGDLLQVSQVISGKLRLDLEVLDLAPLVEAAADTLRPAAAAKSVRLESHLADRVPRVLADPTRAQQIVWNLLSNAIKFTPRGGRVDVSLTQAGSTAMLSVSDSGVGIESDLLPHVFERFRQGHSTSQRTLGGLGLGLTIVRQLMELHGGTVRAESAGAGHGATFTLTFPIPALAERAADARGVTTAALLQGIRVLVVEDEPDARELVAALLVRSGATVTTATSVREAVAYVHARAPDLIVADIGLPDQDGCELMRQVRALEGRAGRAIPALALTARARPRDRDEALAAGFQMHVSKPVDPDEFVGNVARLAQSIEGRKDSHS